MTNKMPVVGKRYKRNFDSKRTYIIVRVISGKDSRTGCETYDIRDENDLNYKAMFNDEFMFDEITFKYEFEELPASNSQEKEEISEVERALEELKEILEEIKFPISIYDFDKKVKERSMIVRVKAQNLVNALEAEKTVMSKQGE